MQETIDTTIGEHQSEVIKNRLILHTISIICDITDVSNKLNKNFSIIFLELILSFLLCIGYEDNLIRMIEVDKHDTPISNLKLK